MSMRIFHGAAPLEPAARGAIWALGNFDGVHRGHQALFTRAKERAGQQGTHSGVLTFSPHPAKVLNPALAPPLILTDAEKEQRIAALGIAFYAVVDFDAALAAQSPAAFITEVLEARLGARGVVVGEGFRFGHHAAGKVETLRASRMEVDEVAPVREGDLICSSSKVRELVLEGKVEAAARLLGRPYDLRGIVVHGDQRGRTIGIPTANLKTERELLPKVGVYAARARVPSGACFDSVCNIGLRPTFDGQDVRIEAHLLGFEGDLYGQELELELHARVREERRFPDAMALKAQIASDIQSARRLLLSPGG